MIAADNTRPHLAAVQCLWLGLLAYGAVMTAMVLQLVYNWNPCPWCILQRYAYLALGTVLLWRSAVADQGRLAHGLSWATALAALTGVGMAGYQLHVMFSLKVACGRDKLAAFLNDLPTAQVFPWAFEATGSCADPMPVNFPLLSLCGFVAIGGCGIWLRQRKVS